MRNEEKEVLYAFRSGERKRPPHESDLGAGLFLKRGHQEKTRFADLNKRGI